MSGVAVTVKKNGWDKAVLVRIISVTLGGCPEKNGYTLIPGNTRTPLRKGKEGKDICSAKVNSISQLKPSLSSELGEAIFFFFLLKRLVFCWTWALQWLYSNR